jgi:NADP-dependent 3-hydroxy acid dehydrogenase YdfG
MEKLVQKTARRTGRVDYMFNNAGIGIGGHVEHFDIDDWNYIVNVNLKGVFNGIQATYRFMV